LGAFGLCLAAPTLGQAAAVTSALENLTRTGNRIRAEFSVTNSGSAIAGTIVVKCTMFDKTGRPLGTATGSVSRLGAGKRATGSATTELAPDLDQVVCRTEAIY
jgi:hypothetical protein